MREKTALQKSFTSPVFYRILTIVYLLLFSVILFLSIFFPFHTGVELPWHFQFPLAITGTGLCFLLFTVCTALPKTDGKAALYFAVLLALLYYFLQIMAGRLFSQGIGDVNSLGKVYGYAAEYANQSAGSVSVDDIGAGNIGLYFLLSGLYAVSHYIGITDFLAVTVFANAFAINLALFLTFLIAKKIFGSRVAVAVYLGLLLYFPLLMQVPILTAGSIGMPVAAGMVYLWLSARINWRKNNTGKLYFQIVLVSLLAAAALTLYSPISALFIAIVIDILCMIGGKEKLISFVLALAFFGAPLYLLFFTLQSSPLILDSQAGFLPFQYYLLQGLQYGGKYNPALFGELAAQNPQGKITSAVVGLEMRNRLDQLGIQGGFWHIGDKLSRMFSDAASGATVWHSSLGAQNTFLSPLVKSGSTVFFVANSLSTSLFLGMLLWSFVGAVKSLSKENYCFAYLRTAVVFFVFHILLWAISPEQLLPFVPLLAICAAEAGVAWGMRKAKNPKIKPLPDKRAHAAGKTEPEHAAEVENHMRLPKAPSNAVPEKKPVLDLPPQPLVLRPKQPPANSIKQTNSTSSEATEKPAARQENGDPGQGKLFKDGELDEIMKLLEV